MTFSLELPPGIKARRWKVKIRDSERLESPHVTVICRRKSWRICLRTSAEMEGSDLSEVAPEVLSVIADRRDELIAAWNTLYPDNPVR